MQWSKSALLALSFYIGHDAYLSHKLQTFGSRGSKDNDGSHTQTKTNRTTQISAVFILL